MAGKLVLVVVFAALLGVLGAQGALECEDLAVEDCAYAVSGSGSRCVLEKLVTAEKNIVYECQTSPVSAERSEAWIETDECLSSCGLERMSVGMSTDGLAQKQFVSKWCSPACQRNCPNIVDLFAKLATGEDVHLPHVCDYLRPASRRLIGTRTELTKGTQQVIDSLRNAAAWAPLPALLADAMTPVADPWFETP